jgi:hypothetical protein
MKKKSWEGYMVNDWKKYCHWSKEIKDQIPPLFIFAHLYVATIAKLPWLNKLTKVRITIEEIE